MAYDDLEDIDDIDDIDGEDADSLTQENKETRADRILRTGKERFLAHDFPAALKIFEDALNSGCTRANYFLGLMYANGLGVTEDTDKAMEYFERGAEQKDDLCRICLLDEDEFLDLYDDDTDEAKVALAESEQDSFFAFQFYKLCDERGSSLVDADVLKSCFRKAADSGNVLAMYELYRFYKDDKNLELALQTLKEAADGQYPKAMVKIGKLYEEGKDGYAQDEELAINYYKTAKDAHSKEANLRLGLLYYKREEYRSAFAFMKRAAKSGYPEAMGKLGLMYKNGWGTKVRPEEAEHWLEEAKKRSFVEDEPKVPAAQEVVGKQSCESETDDFAEAFMAAEAFAGNDREAFPNIEPEQPVEDVPLAEELGGDKIFNIARECLATGISRLDAAKEILQSILFGEHIASWEFYPEISDDSKIKLKKYSYAENVSSFEILGIFDNEKLPAFKYKGGVVLTDEELITSQNSPVKLEAIRNVTIEDNVLKIECFDGSNCQFKAKKVFAEPQFLQKVILCLAAVANAYRS